MITDFSWDQRLHGVTSRDRQSRHSDILADRMQFMTMKREAVEMEMRRCGYWNEERLQSEKTERMRELVKDVYVMDASRGVEEERSTELTKGIE